MLAKTLKKEEGLIDWSQSAATIDRQVRAFTPWPGTFTYLGGDYFKIHRGNPDVAEPSGGAPGMMIGQGNDLLVQTGDFLYRLHEVQPAGKQRMSASAFLLGHPDIIGKTLTGR